MRHLLSARDLSTEEIVALLDTGESMREVSSREVKKIPALRGRTVVNLFFEDSTRTRVSFEAAAKRLSADVLNFAAKGSSVSKGESLKDTVQTLEAIGADVIVMRHPSSGAARQLADSGWTRAHVVNAGDGTHEHPTQALLDAMTMRRFKAQRDGVGVVGTDLAGLNVVIVGDVLHSRVVRSNVWMLHSLGANVTLVAPPTLMPHGVGAWPCSVSYDLDEVLAAQPDVVMMLRIQAERMNSAYFPSAGEYASRWGLSAARFERFIAGREDEVIVMHPGPMNRGLEISSRAADSPQSRILDQVANGVSMRMAALYHVATDPAADTLDPGKDAS
ncbi:aspartate carbamoyltransferase catalytic subunit [Falsarthrobacter nasiphocae]|uniref:Aspartate carbamoyltransferase n=1 Tax=Falsarthrobacter nasiphocae TaxID=189863 RepID=A0AAE3YIW9_9MICC|nr:aspartate carbamoyltransferase catalytic subunit [Falsarthrobacter nasiphocae]MDR6892984.1 aspartate carbamoyltransferase catalytic subunit [Falsarthrobacter nasiphocae]